MIQHGQKIEWRERDGSRTAVEVHNRATRQAALYDALATARDMGWTPPKWWQWWRWGDIDYARKLEEV